MAKTFRMTGTAQRPPMTEIEWLIETDNPRRMLYRLLNYPIVTIDSMPSEPDPKIELPSPRKLRLFACACCRAVWRHPRLLYSVMRAADGNLWATPPANEYGSGQWATEIAERYADGPEELKEEFNAANGVGSITSWEVPQSAAEEAIHQGTVNWPHLTLPKAVEIIHHIFGNPFRPIWSTECPHCQFYTRLKQETFSELRYRKPQCRVCDSRGWLPNVPCKCCQGAGRLDDDYSNGTIQCQVCWGSGGECERPSISASAISLAEALYKGADCSFALHDALLECGLPEFAAHFSSPTADPWKPGQPRFQPGQLVKKIKDMAYPEEAAKHPERFGIGDELVIEEVDELQTVPYTTYNYQLLEVGGSMNGPYLHEEELEAVPQPPWHPKGCWVLDAILDKR